MANLIINDDNYDFAQELIQMCRNRDVQLTPNSELLVTLSVEAWFEEIPQLSKNTRTFDKRELARKIVDLAVREKHVTKGERINGRVRYDNWFYSLAVSGRKILRDIFDKRF